MKTLKAYLLIALAMLATLTGCGPGTGGTGTGPSISTNAPVAPISGPITYSGTQNSLAAVFGGTSTEKAASVFGPTVSTLKNAVLSLDVKRIDLRKACQGFTYIGDWIIDLNGNTRILGTYSSTRLLPDGPPEITTFVATLSLNFASGNAASQSVTATVTDSAGSIFLGPMTLQISNDFGSGSTACGSV